MIKVFIVSLSTSPRRSYIEKKCRDNNIEFEFIDAVNGKNLSRDFVLKINKLSWTRDKYKRELGESEIGCSLSHHKIYERIKDDNDWFIILEDDVSFGKDINSLIHVDLNKSNFEPSSLYLLGGQNGLDSFKHVIFSKFGKEKISEDLFFYKTLFSERFLFRTCCYLIHSDLAKKILLFNGDKITLADDWYNLSKYKVINNMYYADIIDHPSNIYDSLIDAERKAFSNKNQSIFWGLLKKIALTSRKLLRFL